MDANTTFYLELDSAERNVLVEAVQQDLKATKRFRNFLQRVVDQSMDSIKESTLEIARLRSVLKKLDAVEMKEEETTK